VAALLHHAPATGPRVRKCEASSKRQEERAAALGVSRDMNLDSLAAGYVPNPSVLRLGNKCMRREFRSTNVAPVCLYHTAVTSDNNKQLISRISNLGSNGGSRSFCCALQEWTGDNVLAAAAVVRRSEIASEVQLVHTLTRTPGTRMPLRTYLHPLVDKTNHAQCLICIFT
jgi:hypothetical protein